VATAAFLLLAAAAVAGALLVVLNRNPLYSALSLVGVFLATAVIYLTLSAPLLAVLQVLVYAGAIMVLFVFVIMLLSLRHDESGEMLGLPTGFKRGSAILLAGAFLVQMSFLGATLVLSGRSGTPPAAGEALGSPFAVGERLFQGYLIPFQMTGILLLVAIVGAVAITRRHGQGLAGSVGREDAP
jgi:NADH-quinone oxidoreductase subunit J